ncbi:MAG: hypothetical protein ABIW82_16415 [Dokdonella sp.]
MSNIAIRHTGAAILALAFSGCMQAGLRVADAPAATGGPRLEVVDKHADQYQLLGNGRVRILSRGEFVLDHEDQNHLYIAIYPANAPISASPLPALEPEHESPVRNRTGAIKLVDVGHGLPHAGQWRDNFAVGDLLGDGSTQLIFPPARKSGDLPALFREQGDQWQRVPLRVPATGYDYGGAAIADVDGDGRNDLVLAAHLKGFSALHAEADGHFSLFDAGLPNRQKAEISGSGVAVLTLPSAAGSKAATVLLLRESVAGGASRPLMPGIAAYRYDPAGFIGTPLGENKKMSGNSMAFAAATPRCAAKLVIGSSYLGPPPLLESSDAIRWTVRTIDTFPDPAARVGAVTLGDADGDGCSDLAVAYSRRIGAAWHSMMDVYLDRGDHWLRINLLDQPRDARVTAMAFGATPKHPAGELLFALDNNGTLRAYDISGGSGEILFERAAPEWRHGCAASDVRILPADTNGALRIAASFAGEPIMGAFDRCPNGGGIEAWRIDDANLK